MYAKTSGIGGGGGATGSAAAGDAPVRTPAATTEVSRIPRNITPLYCAARPGPKAQGSTVRISITL